MAVVAAIASVVAAVAWGQFPKPRPVRFYPDRGPELPATAPITLGLHVATNNGASSSTTVAVVLGTPTVGSAIVCDVKFQTDVNIVSVSDNVNGAYLAVIAPLRDETHNFTVATYYRENVAASSTTVTLTYSAARTGGQMACKELKGAATSYALDSTVSASRHTTGTNANAGTTMTPLGNGRFINATASFDSATTPTAGTNFTLLDGASVLWPEYWIQTTATATTGPFTSSNLGYAVALSAFAPAYSGTCDTSVVLDYHGGTPGNAVNTTTLNGTSGNSYQDGAQRGGNVQPNSDRNYDGIANTNAPGWTVGGTSANLTYVSDSAVPFATTLNCPSYSGTANSGTVLRWTTANGVTGNATYFFPMPTPSSIAVGLCFWSDYSATDTFINDTWVLRAGNDYVNMILDNVGSGVRVSIEAPGGGSGTYTLPNPSSKYWLAWQWNTGGTHHLNVYNGCGSNPALLQSLNATAKASGGNASQLQLGNGGFSDGANNPGHHWWFGPVKINLKDGTVPLP